MKAQYLQPYSRAVIKLLKGPVEKDSPIWGDIITYQADIQEYIGVIGLELIVKKDDGFAFVRQVNFEDDARVENIVTRHRIKFEPSVVLFVLRQMLEDFDTNPTETQSTDKYVTSEEIKDEVTMFLPKRHNFVKLMQELDKYIAQVADYGFLVKPRADQSGNRYRIHRIIKEKITLDDLIEFKNQLNYYVTGKSV